MHVGLGQRAQRHEGPVPARAEAGAPVDQLGAGEAEDEHGQVAHPVHQVLEEVQEPLVGVVEVLDEQQDRSGAGRVPRRSVASRRTARPGAAPRRSRAGRGGARAGPPRRPGRSRRRREWPAWWRACPRSGCGRRPRRRRGGRGRSRSAPRTPCPRRRWGIGRGASRRSRPARRRTSPAPTPAASCRRRPARRPATRRGRRWSLVACSTSLRRPNSTPRPTKGASKPSERWAPPMPETISRACHRRLRLGLALQLDVAVQVELDGQPGQPPRGGVDQDRAGRAPPTAPARRC